MARFNDSKNRDIELLEFLSKLYHQAETFIDIQHGNSHELYYAKEDIWYFLEFNEKDKDSADLIGHLLAFIKEHEQKEENSVSVHHSNETQCDWSKEWTHPDAVIRLDLSLQITGGKKHSAEGATLFAVRVN